MEKTPLNLILITLCIVFGGIIMYDMMTRMNIIEGLEAGSFETTPETAVVPPVEPASSVPLPIPETDGTQMTEAEKENQRKKIESANTELLKASLALTVEKDKKASLVSSDEIAKLTGDVVAAEAALIIATSTIKIPALTVNRVQVVKDPTPSPVLAITTPTAITTTSQTYESTVI